MNKWKIATFALATLIMSTYTIGLVSNQPVIGQPERYVDSEAIIDLSLLPGVRINLWANQDVDVFSDETTHIQHGFVSNSPWDEMSAAEQTEFLSTSKFRFFYSNEEVPLNHIIRFDTQDGHMYSMFYRVFPPGFFPVGQNQIRGEWSWLVSGSWEFYEDTGTVKVSKAGEPDDYEPNNNDQEATNLGDIFVGIDEEQVTANIFPSTDIDWYSFHTIDDPFSPFEDDPLIMSLGINPGSFVIEVWKSDTPNFSEAVEEFVLFGTYYEYQGTMGVDDSAYYWVKVFNPQGEINYEDYTILIDHNGP
jgi:hypothetical protein